jgi:hypothetical protein
MTSATQINDRQAPVGKCNLAFVPSTGVIRTARFQKVRRVAGTVGVDRLTR